jgi:hypothetical protein
MKAHQVKNGVVVNTIEVESLNFMPNLINGETGGIGWLWDGETLTPPPEPQKTADELQAEARAQRNQLLTASDWTQVADAPVDKAAWATYRQALRDIPQQEGFPTTIVWPVKPE